MRMSGIHTLPTTEERSSVAGQREAAPGQEEVRIDLSRPASPVQGQIGQMARVT